MNDKTHEELVALISWMLVELDNKSPNLPALREAASKALLVAAHGGLKHDSSIAALRRMAKIWGE